LSVPPLGSDTARRNRGRLAASAVCATAGGRPPHDRGGRPPL